jgi:hypothetical protein
MTVQELRNAGYKVRVHHCRINTVDGPKPKGGYTSIVIDGPMGDHYEGVAECSHKDNYNKKLGVKIALGRCDVDVDFMVNK